MSDATVVLPASTPDRPQGWSVDAWAMARPADAFRHLASHLPASSAWTALRRPLFVTVVLACGFTLLSAGVLTLRIVVSAAVYWSFVPATEVAALALLTRGSRRLSLSRTIDMFFVGHGPMTLQMLALVATLSMSPDRLWWRILTGPALWAFLAALVWSAYVDARFFRHVLNMTRARALRSLIVLRLLTWTSVFVVFAVPSPRLLAAEVADVVRELFS